MRLLAASCASVLAAVALTSACETSSVSGLDDAGGGATSASSSSAGGGGGAASSSPLHMTHAVLTDGLTVHVTFSEPVVVPPAIDPTDFRLAATVLLHAGVTSCTSCGYMGDYYCFPHYSLNCSDGQDLYTPVRDLSLYEDVGAVVAVAGSAADGGLDLTLARGLPYDASLGLSLHYAPGDAPVTDAAGDAPSPAGPAWVHDAERAIKVPGFLAEGALGVDNDVLSHYRESATSCGDGVQDSTETDVDCGGTTDPDTYGSGEPDYTLCMRCDPGKKCLADSDCSSQSCVMGRCAM